MALSAAASTSVLQLPSPQKTKVPKKSKKSKFEFFMGDAGMKESEWDPSASLSHAGKWPIEEEIYANRLVVEFAAGLLDDCEDGTTLRSYLSTKLRCAPMRISKKFAGKSIGSKVFVRKEGSRDDLLSDLSSFQNSSNSLQRRLNRRKRKEKNKNQRPRKRNRQTETDDREDEYNSNEFLQYATRVSEDGLSHPCDYDDSNFNVLALTVPNKKPRKDENVSIVTPRDDSLGYLVKAPFPPRVVSADYLPTDVGPLIDPTPNPSLHPIDLLETHLHMAPHLTKADHKGFFDSDPPIDQNWSFESDPPIVYRAITPPNEEADRVHSFDVESIKIEKGDLDVLMDEHIGIKQFDDFKCERSFHTLGGYNEWCDAMCYFSTQDMHFYSQVKSA
mmetsp:Transcript_2895/g.3031  ORF Transcript_2895/g.3031 Transcript_2895/m.3031 type:complete len:389 (-) Transcript_2895:139-1305(-)|eukprot:CAMPEP_0119050760 /NCGR_PEP_ID=MMETSP1177-20130426/71637_1 /TAXON_ID=2985 /ORGANISM="Ochromonas sp, Strain CCMP1899" /LENGTH=388 /DNA_ID=CAMNT_0007029525 /DNA_START=113 /DNA_END=1279 /DNA_ORIENTATION=-